MAVDVAQEDQVEQALAEYRIRSALRRIRPGKAIGIGVGAAAGAAVAIVLLVHHHRHAEKANPGLYRLHNPFRTESA